MLPLLAVAHAEPLWGDADPLGDDGLVVIPSVDLHPVNGYGGDIQPGLVMGVGLGGGFDLRGGSVVDVPVYHRDDGAFAWGYAPPSIESWEIAGRWFYAGDDGAALRLSRDRYETLGIGPQFFGASGAGPFTFAYRGEYTFHLVDSAGDLGVLAGTFALTLPLGDNALFAEIEPSAWMMLSSPKGDGTRDFVVQLDAVARVGGWLHLGGTTRLGVAGAWTPDPDAVEGLSLGVRLRLGL